MKLRMQMTKTLIINKNTEQCVLDFLKLLLVKKKISGVFSLKKIDKKGAIAYSLITNTKDLEDAEFFYPLMPVNAGKLLSRFTLKGSPKEPIVAVVKPCELRGFIELIKREQGSMDNLLIISSTCSGVYPTKFEIDGTIEKNLTKYWNSVKKGEIPNDLRLTCTSCEEFIPYNADITVDLVGNKDLDTKCVMVLNTKKAEDLFKILNENYSDKQINYDIIDKIRKIRTNEKKKLFEEIENKMKGIDNLIDIFGKCIGCHGCSKVCPICYCVLCEFESSDSEYSPSNIESKFYNKPGLRIPHSTVYYHLGRLSHISISCVGCGSCNDVCPVDIPISMIFKKVSESVQKMFEYIPGKDPSEKIPLTTFEQDEYAEFEK